MTEKLSNFRGTYLKEEDFTENKVIFTEYKPNAQYAWDTGVAMSRYLQELKAGKLIGVRCERCNHTVGELNLL